MLKWSDACTATLLLECNLTLLLIHRLYSRTGQGAKAFFAFLSDSSLRCFNAEVSAAAEPACGRVLSHLGGACRTTAALPIKLGVASSDPWCILMAQKKVVGLRV